MDRVTRYLCWWKVVGTWWNSWGGCKLVCTLCYIKRACLMEQFQICDFCIHLSLQCIVLFLFILLLCVQKNRWGSMLNFFLCVHIRFPSISMISETKLVYEPLGSGHIFVLLLSEPIPEPLCTMCELWLRFLGKS